MKVESKQFAFDIIKKFSVDREGGRLTNVVLLTGDREAKTHGIWIDEKTLQSALDAINEKGGQLKAKIAHDTFREYWNEEDRILENVGYFSQISIQKGQLVAGSFEFFDTFKEANPLAVNHLLEMAEKTPDLFGMSIEPWGYAVYVDESGVEYGTEPEDVELLYNGMPALRVTELSTAAFVDEPSANNGLFAKLSKAFSGDNAKLSKLFDALISWSNRDDSDAEGYTGPLSRKQNSKNNNTEVMNKEKIKALKAKFSQDQAKQGRALVLLSEDDSLSVEQIEASINAEDSKAKLTRLEKENTDLKTANTGLQGQVTKLTTERDSFKSKYESIKGSGEEHEHDLGNEDDNEVINPWAKETLNYTAQSEMLGSNPGLAKKMKEEAGK